MAKVKNFIRRYVSISAVIDTLSRKELALLDPQSWDDRNDRYFMGLYKTKKELPALYAMCGALCSETYHHWRVFTAGTEGACLEIKRMPLENVLGQSGAIRYGAMEYLLLDQVEELNSADLERLPFCKRSGFADEEEYRVVAWSQEKQAAALGVEIDLAWVNKIYLNPWIPEPLASSVKVTLQGIPGCSKIEVSRSRLIDNRRWKKAGDKVIGRKPMKDLVKLSLKRSGS